jgi:hypothetical protein
VDNFSQFSYNFVFNFCFVFFTWWSMNEESVNCTELQGVYVSSTHVCKTGVIEGYIPAGGLSIRLV